MSKQNYKINKIDKVICRCADKECKLSYGLRFGIEVVTFVPTINNQGITEYIDKNGNKQTVPTIYTKQGAINQAYQIAKLCPNFNKAR
ncbi:MAG: hypothetical protein IKL14_02695 [Alphaproteobacteria bacterium]|nr:hypothetical protein [Alphaproteobacteria bacterium]